MTEAISADFLYYVLIAGAALAGAIIGWSIRSDQCAKQVAILDSHLDSNKQQILARDQELSDKRRKITTLTGELARVRGDAGLYESRWKSQLQKNRQLSPYQTWVNNLQKKLAAEKIRHAQNRAYAETMANRYSVTRENLIRVHAQLTATSKHLQDVKQWSNVFQTRNLKHKTDLGQLRSYANSQADKLAVTKENLNRAHQRITELDQNNALWKDWTHVFQTRNLKHKTDLGQLRSYANSQADKLAVTKENLNRAHQRITELDQNNALWKDWTHVFQTRNLKHKTDLGQLRSYANSQADKLAVTKENLNRAHQRITELDQNNALWKDWTHVFQSKLKKRNIEYQQLRNYSVDTAQRLTTCKQNLAVVHNRLTEIDGKQQPLKTWIRVFQNKLKQRDAGYAALEQYRVAGNRQLQQKIDLWKDWTHVFQSKLKKRNIEYQQLRNYSVDTAQRLTTCKQNLAVVHNRLTEIDGKQQPLKTWIRVFQNKYAKKSTDYKQLRHYADTIGSELTTTKKNLRFTHDRLTVVERDAELMRKQVGGLVVAEVPREADVPDNASLRLMDKIRLFGTSKSDIFGRFSNQVRQARLEAADRERTLVNSCEEKDAIITDLKQEIRRLEKQAQRGPEEIPLDQAVRIKELQSELARIQDENSRLPSLERLIQEHELTIDAFRSKLQNMAANDPKPAPAKASKPQKTVKAKSVSRTHQEPDDLKKINGIGPKLEKILNEHGLYTFAQVAALTQKDIQVLSTKLGSFKDRIKRDNWVGKARNLHKNKYGKDV